MEYQQNAVRRIFAGFQTTQALVALALVVLGYGIPVFAENDDGKFCSITTRAASLSCRSEAKEEYWNAVGNCQNLSDSDAREECSEEASEELPEARNECADQREARDGVCEAIGEAPYDPEINPANFVSPAEAAANPNLYFPLISGNIWRYEGDGETIEVEVTGETKEILGVECIVVRDVVREDGEVVEDTADWYAQDVDGNIWYFGELSKEFEDGELVSLEGSWKSGVDGAKPGIIMFSAPVIGTVYRQEFFLGDAEDMGEVLSLTGSETTPAAECDGDCLVTKDYSPLEPDEDAVEHKYYKAGLGMIVEVKPATGERVELVEVITP